MSGLRYTKLRHQMLAAIADGKVDRAKTGIRTWNIRDAAATYGAMDNAIRYLIRGDTAAVDRSAGWSFGGPVVLTPAGRVLLAEWDTQHPASPTEE